MELYHLSMDALRLIFAELDLSSLVKLNATFNHRIQAHLRASGAIHTVDLKEAKGLLKAPVKHLLHALRDVHSFVLFNDACWSPASLGLLKSLNPLEITLGKNIIHDSASQLQKDATLNPEDLELRKLVSYMQPVGFPNLAFLTTRLQTLKLLHYMRDCFWLEFDRQQLSLPSTLTHVCIPYFSTEDPPIIDKLPTSLLKLEIGWCDHALLAKIFDRFTSLESLAADPMWLQYGNVLESNPNTRAPASLTSLRGSLMPSPLSLFGGPLFERCRLLELSLTTSLILDKQQLADGAVFTFPSTVTSLELLTRSHGNLTGHAAATLFLPPTLSTLIIDQFECSWEIIEALPKLLSLTHLSISLHRPQLLKAFPPALKTLRLDRKVSMDETEIAALPTGLTFLKDPQMLLTTAEIVHRRCPECLVQIMDINLWAAEGTELRRKFASLRAPIFDVDLFVATVDQYARDQKLRFVLVLNDSTQLKITAMTTSISLKSSFSDTTNIQVLSNASRRDDKFSNFATALVAIFNKSLQRLDLDKLPFVMPPKPFAKLTHINLGNCTPTGPCAIPIATTHLIASSHYITPTSWTAPASNIIVLDTPNWALSKAYLSKCKLDKCEKLRCVIAAIPDAEVVDFVKNKFSPRTRRNMSVSILFELTGALVPGDDENGVKTIDHDVLNQVTLDALQRELSAPMPPLLDVSSNLMDLDGELPIGDTTIGSVVHSMNSHPVESLMIPFSATTVSLLGTDGWTLKPNTRHADLSDTTSSAMRTDLKIENLPNGENAALTLPVPGLFSPSNVLTRLELQGIVNINEVWASLPTSLRLLRIIAPKLIASIDHRFPPHLETLILHETNDSITTQLSRFPSKVDQLTTADPNDLLLRKNLRFSLSQLPSTLRHLDLRCDIGTALLQSDMQYRYSKAPESHLPDLRTVIFGELSGLAGPLMRLLPLHQLDRFVLVSEKFPRKTTDNAVITFTYPAHHPVASSKVVKMKCVKAFDLDVSGL